MKSYPVALTLCSAACALALGACSSANGPLFEDVGAPAEVVAEPSSPEPFPAELEVKPPTGPPEQQELPNGMEPTSASESPDDDLPLSSEGEIDDDEMNGGGPQQPPAPEPPPEPVLPAVVAVVPDNGATAVSGDTPIVITFSVPMNQAATEGAYQSESIPSSSVSFAWNDDGTQLTVTPNAPLAYDSGTDADSVEALRYSFFISSSAEDLEGNRLPVPAESSFSVLREITQTFQAIQDRDLTGSFRSNGTYGNGDCARSATMTCVGDQRVQRDSEQYKGFISFDVSSLPSSMAQISGARLSLEITGTSGNPFGGLGRLMLEHTAFDAIGMPAFTAPPITALGVLATNGNAGTVLSRGVLPALDAAAIERGMTQFRLSFEDFSDNDIIADAILSTWETHLLEVTYLIP